MNREPEQDMERLPTRPNPNFGSFDNEDLWVTAAMVAAGIILWMFINILMVLVVASVWFVFMNRTKRGRPYYVVLTKMRSAWKTSINHGNVWTRGEATIENQSAKPRAKRRPDRGVEVIPFEVTSVPSDRHGDESIGVLHHKEQHTDTVIIVGDGSNIPSVGAAGQHEAYEAFADMVKSLIGVERGYSVGVSYVLRRDPFNSFELSSNLDNLLHPEAVIPSSMHLPEGSELTADDQRWLVIGGNYSMLEEIAKEYAREVWMATVITIRRQGVLVKAQANRTINPKYIGRLPINNIVEAAITGLERCGVVNPRPLDLKATHSFVRGAWDTETIDEYYQAVSEDPEAVSRAGFTLHWPQKQMQVADKHSVSDGTFTRVLRVTGTPELVWQGYFSLFDGGIKAPYYSRALVGEAVRSNREIWFLERATAVMGDIAEIVGVNHRTLKAIARDEHLEQRKRDIFNSQLSQSYNILIAVHADSEEVLNARAEQAEQAARSIGMQVDVIDMAEHQYPALWSATTGINML